jgi:hypothetical protein
MKLADRSTLVHGSHDPNCVVERRSPGQRCVFNVRVAPRAGLAGPNRATKVDARCGGVPVLALDKPVWN